MAQKVEVVLTCDLDEADTAAVETVEFAYEGQAYAFELCQEHLDEFHNVMQGYTAAARKEGSGARRSASTSSPVSRAARPAANPSELATMREWARTNGYEVSDRGRISAQVREAFEAAQR